MIDPPHGSSGGQSRKQTQTRLVSPDHEEINPPHGSSGRQSYKQTRTRLASPGHEETNPPHGSSGQRDPRAFDRRQQRRKYEPKDEPEPRELSPE